MARQAELAAPGLVQPAHRVQPGLQLAGIVEGTGQRLQRVQAGRRAAQQLRQAAQVSHPEADDVVSAILTNASLAAMDIADSSGAGVAPLLEEVEASARRAAVLYGRIRQHFS